jgi:hypothetical protein
MSDVQDLIDCAKEAVDRGASVQPVFIALAELYVGKDAAQHWNIFGEHIGDVYADVIARHEDDVSRLTAVHQIQTYSDGLWEISKLAMHVLNFRYDDQYDGDREVLEMPKITKEDALFQMTGKIIMLYKEFDVSDNICNEIHCGLEKLASGLLIRTHESRQRRQYKERVGFIERMKVAETGLWMIACNNHANPLAEFGTKHVAVNVAGDGSCFYQCLYYLLIWYHKDARKMLEGKMTLHGMKMMIYNAAFDRKGNVKRGDAGQIVELTAIDSDGLAKLLGISDTAKSERSVYASDVVFNLADVVFDVQIIIFHQSSAINRNGPSLERKGRAYRHEYDEHLKYSGKQVFVILHQGRTTASGHFQIISRFPLLDGMNEDGTGILGRNVPMSIKLAYYKENSGEEGLMPTLRQQFSLNNISSLDR